MADKPSSCQMCGFFIIGCISALGVAVLVSSELLPPESSSKEMSTSDKPCRTDVTPYLMQKLRLNNENKSIPMDHAKLVVNNTLTITADICFQSSECWKCPPVRLMTVQPNSTGLAQVDTRWHTNMYVVHQRNETSYENICSVDYHFGEYGQYQLVVSKVISYTCVFVPIKPPTDSFLPIYVAIGLIILLSVVWTAAYQIHRRKLLRRLLQCRNTEGLIDSDLGTTHSGQEDTQPGHSSGDRPVLITKPRLRSVDTFRGLCLLIMIFVNYGGGSYWFFKHSPWNGLTVADLVFPWFTFIMGTSIALAFRSLLRRGFQRHQLALKVIRRTVILFGFGIMISNMGSKALVNIHELRVPGVLQRLAVSYFVIAMLEVAFAQAADYHQAKWWAPVRDVLSSWAEWLVALSILAIHCFLTFLLPVPNCPRGYLGPGGLHENGSHWNCTGGAAGYIDRVLFGDSHIYKTPTCRKIYLTETPYDPEGTLGTLTSIFICFLGLQAGKIFTTYQGTVSRLSRWLVWALITGLVAGVLCKFSQNDGWIPVNKNLWSVSFILALASMAFVLLIVCFLLCDVWHVWSGTPFFYPGMNSILVYLGHEFLHRCFPIQFHVASNHATLLAMNMYGAALWLIVSIALYLKGVFIAI